jgi:hypothetical protein
MKFRLLGPSIVADLFRERRRVQLARLRIKREKAEFRLSFQRMLRDTLASPRGLAICAGLGATVGFIRREPSEHQGLWSVRSLASLVLWIEQLHRTLDPAPD